MRLKFQTKLMLTVALVVVLVTGLVITATEDKVRATYSRLAEARFEEQVEVFLEMKNARVEFQKKLLEKIATRDDVKNVLKAGEFSPDALGVLRRVLDVAMGAERSNSAASKFPRLAGRGKSKQGVFSGNMDKMSIALIDHSGEIHTAGGGKFHNKGGYRNVLKELQEIDDYSAPQTGYLIVESVPREKQLLEVVVAPVRSGEGKDLLGAVLIGQPFGLKGPQKQKNNARQIKTKRPDRGNVILHTGVMTEGEIFSPTIPDEAIAQLKEVLIADDEAASTLGERLDHEVEVEIEGESFRVFCEEVNSTSTFPISYQVVLYPMKQLQSDLLDLRLKGSGVGTGAMWVGVLLAWLLARRFARPIRELAKATEEIREGNYEANVPVRSKDEVGDLAKSFNEMAGELKTKEQIRDVLGKVADEAVADALISGSLELGGETREVSILFCDIRGFTSLSETMEPTDVIELLNDHMTAMTHIVYKHQGVVDKFVGDEIMAVFGAPKAYGDDAISAAQCALDMLEERERLNRSLERPIDIGIGVATGSVVVGCIGSMDRLNYTVIGERVNRASHMCGIAGPGQAIVDEVTWQAIADRASGTELENVKLKGYAGAVKAFLLEDFPEKVEQVLGG